MKKRMFVKNVCDRMENVFFFISKFIAKQEYVVRSLPQLLKMIYEFFSDRSKQSSHRNQTLHTETEA